jgi:NAD(P)-dependent dehydrogenase (short-subunit alcohol dehydrogenase family)
MRTLVVGTGTLGQPLAAALRSRGHDVITAARTSGDVHVDLTDHATVEAMYRRVGAVDNVVCVAAHGALDDFRTLTAQAMNDNMRAKFLGQADLVLTGQHHCADGASFTLTSGIFADQAWPGVTGGGVISGALHSFVLSAAIELPRGMRVNVVSPGMIGDTFSAHFPGLRPIPVHEVLPHYLDCVATGTGRVIRVH